MLPDEGHSSRLHHVAGVESIELRTRGDAPAGVAATVVYKRGRCLKGYLKMYTVYSSGPTDPT